MLSEKLLDTAVDHFGRHGFEGASTRAIAKASGTAMSSITYHFGGKQGLYIAAAEHIARSIWQISGSRVEMLQTIELQSPRQALDLLLGLVDAFAKITLRPESAAWAQFIIREQQHPTEAFERIYNGVMCHVLAAAMRMTAYLRPDLNEREIRATCLLMFGQVLSLRSCRAAVCRTLGTETLGMEEEKLMRTRLHATISAIISGDQP